MKTYFYTIPLQIEQKQFQNFHPISVYQKKITKNKESDRKLFKSNIIAWLSKIENYLKNIPI